MQLLENSTVNNIARYADKAHNKHPQSMLGDESKSMPEKDGVQALCVAASHNMYIMKHGAARSMDLSPAFSAAFAGRTSH